MSAALRAALAGEGPEANKPLPAEEREKCLRAEIAKATGAPEDRVLSMSSADVSCIAELLVYLNDATGETAVTDKADPDRVVDDVRQAAMMCVAARAEEKEKGSAMSVVKGLADMPLREFTDKVATQYSPLTHVSRPPHCEKKSFA